MTIAMSLDNLFLVWLLNLCAGGALLLALWLAPWQRLRGQGRIHVWFAAAVMLLILWQLAAPVRIGLSYHLLGVTALTLMFGWSLTLILTALAWFGLALNGHAQWGDLAANQLVCAVVPATITQLSLLLARAWLPRNYFVFVLVNGFLTGGLAAASGALLALVLVSGGSGRDLFALVLPYFPLMFLPEAFLNGWAMAVLAAFKPQWVYSFVDEQYIHGK